MRSFIVKIVIAALPLFILGACASSGPASYRFSVPDMQSEHPSALRDAADQPDNTLNAAVTATIPIVEPAQDMHQ